MNGRGTIHLAFVMFAVAGLGALPTAGTAAAQEGDLPDTVYEDPAIGAQAMDYDAESKTFPAHPGWVQDKKIHYYKFQMYTPGSYPDVVGPGTDNRVPVAPLYLVTTGDPSDPVDAFEGIPEDQLPLVAEFPTKDNTDYSDFVQIHWVPVDEGYEPNSFASADDLPDDTVETDIYANAPVVPVGSSLEHPTEPGDAPIDALTVWYEDKQAQAFVFETTSQAFADHFNPITRTDEAAEAGSGFEIPVTDDWMNDGRVSAMPIWHVNQLWTGVTPGENNGGPSAKGQQNTISVDRLDSGYSPLWQVFWVTQVPPGYEADQASHSSQFQSENGFELKQTPMFVNCPNIGPHGGGETNTAKADSFEPEPTLEAGEETSLEGALVMPGEPTEVTLKVGGETVATTETNPMGGYAFTLSAEELAPGANEVTVEDPDGETVATWTISSASGADTGDDRQPAPLPGAAVIVATLAVASILVARARS